MSIEPTLERLFLSNTLRIAGLLLCMTGAATLQAAELPIVENTTYNGTAIIWSAVDTAIGYNIYRDGFYVDTVVEVTEYIPNTRGRYQVTAFDGNGNFSPLIATNESGTFTSYAATVNTPNATVSQIQNVTGMVYSNSAGELYWDRETSRELKYSVTVNGVELGSTTGNSFWINSLLVDAENLVTLTASRGSSFESDPTTFIFDTRSNFYPTAASLSTSALIIAPRNARIEIYGETVAELFWDRASASENVVTTEIYRDNVLIGTSPGNSFYDDTRSSRTNYTYDIIAINANGQRSAPAVVNPNGFDGEGEQVVSTMLAGISMQVSDNPHTRFYTTLKTIATGGFEDQLTRITTNIVGLSDGSLGTQMIFRCSNATDQDIALGSGQMTLTLEGGLLFTRRVTLKECTINGEIFSGSYTFGSSEDSLETINYFNVNILSSFEDMILVNMSGKITDSISDQTNRSIVYSDFKYYYEDFVNFDSFTQATLNQAILYFNTDGNERNSFTTSMNVSAPWTGGRSVMIDTTEFFSQRDPSTGNYTLGQLDVTSENGESLFWSANTGDARSWFAELNSTQSATSITGNWSELIRLPCIVLDGEC